MHAHRETPPAATRAVILAGGASTRLPTGKPGAALWGSTLLELAVETVRLAALTPIACARPQTELPVTAAEVWREPATGRPPHPLAAIAWCLERGGEPLVFLPVDLPLLAPDVLRAVADASGESGLAVLARGGRPAALIVRATPEHAPALAQAAAAGAPVLRTLIELGAGTIDCPLPLDGRDPLTNVNTPQDLAGLAARAAPPWRAPR